MDKIWKLLQAIGGYARGLAGLGVVVRVIGTAAGFGLSWAAILTWWATMPFWLVKAPLFFSGTGAAFLGAGAAFGRWRNTPVLPDSFHEDARHLDRHVQVFSEAVYAMYYQYAKERGGDQRIWWKTSSDAWVREFAEAVYIGNGDTSPNGFRNRSKVAAYIDLDQFKEFHRARSEITSFLSRWYPRMIRDRRAREQALERLTVPSTVRALAVAEALEVALAAALGNPIGEGVGWKRMLRLVGVTPSALPANSELQGNDQGEP